MTERIDSLGRPVRESSLNQWYEIKPSDWLDSRKARMMKVFIEANQSLTVDEAKLIYTRMFLWKESDKNLERNELAKVISTLCEQSNKLTQLPIRECRISNKKVHCWIVNKNPRQRKLKYRCEVCKGKGYFVSTETQRDLFHE